MIIPVYNDRQALEVAICSSLQALSTITKRFELIIAEDGSTDGTAELARRYENTDDCIRVFHSDDRCGRGKALSRAVCEARGGIVCYYDVDLATGLDHLAALIDLVRKGNDIATGSRLMLGSDVERTAGREMASRTYNFLVRLVLGSILFDHQCDFKAFNRDRLLSLLPAVQSDRWFWDTEVLLRAQRRGFRCVEFTVAWHAGKRTTVSLRDAFEMGWSILRLWWQIHAVER